MAALEKARWPDGFRCPRCHGHGHGLVYGRRLNANSVGTAAIRPRSRRRVCCGPPEPANVTAQPEQALASSPAVRDTEWWAIQPWRLPQGPWPFIQSPPPTPVVVTDGIELDPEDEQDYVWADSAYSGACVEDLLSLGGFESLIHEKGARNHRLSNAAKELNRVKSSIRACVEHVIGCISMSRGES